MELQCFTAIDGIGVLRTCVELVGILQLNLNKHKNIQMHFTFLIIGGFFAIGDGFMWNFLTRFGRDFRSIVSSYTRS